MTIPPMPTLRIAAAQSISLAGDIAANVLTHTRFIDAAHHARVNLLLFPELSLSGYELPLIQDCLLDANHPRLALIRSKVLETNITVIVGAPVSMEKRAKPGIGAITFYPDGSHVVYCKRHLHPGEELFAAQGVVFSRRDELLGKSFSLAICADTSHETHARNAAATGASLYLASVLASEAGYAADSANMRRYASALKLGVLMANHGAPPVGMCRLVKVRFGHRAASS